MPEHCVDLFSGSGQFSSAFQAADGWEVTTVDIRPECNPDIRADVLALEPKDLPDADVVVASPPCPDFSLACVCDKWDHDSRRRPEHLPQKKQIAESVKVVFHTLWLIREADPDWWFMENPKGMLRKWIGEPVGTVHYCQYGDDHKKPTDLWGMHPSEMAYRKCQGRPDCHVSMQNHTAGNSTTRAVDGTESKERAKVPVELSQAIFEAVESAGPVPEPPEQSTLGIAATDGGRSE